MRQIEFDLPKNYVTDLITKRYFQGSYSAAYASYDPQSLVVYCGPPRVVPSQPDGSVSVEDLVAHIEARLTGVTSPEERFSILFQESAWSHEIQHFHDCICTANGIRAFIAEWELIFDIYARLKSLRRKGWLASGPIFAEIQHEETKQAFNSHCNLILRRLLYNGDLPTIPVNPETADYDIAWGNLEIFGTSLRIPYFAARLEIDGSPACLLIPIGFRALTECRSIQRQNLIVRNSGQELVRMFLKRLRPYHEYRVVNLLITRLAKNNGLNPHEGEWDEVLFRACGAALAQGWTPSLGFTPGTELIKVLEEMSPSEVLNKSFWAENVRSAKATISDLEYPPTPDQWAGFWIRDFVIRSFRQATAVYEAANDDVFPPDSLSWYATLGNSLPQPLASLSDGQVGFSLREDQKYTATFLQNAAAWVMLRCLLEQTMYESLLVCPVLEGQYQGFLQKMSIHPYCPKGVSEGGCGRVEIGADISDHPACAFRLLVTDIGLATSSGHVAYHP